MRIRLLCWSFLLAAGLLLATCVPVNRSFRSTPGGTRVYVVSNGFHTDLVLPLRDEAGTNWLTFLGSPDWTQRFGHCTYVGLGWGDEGFYMGSYGGKTPGVGTTLRAVFWPTPTLMHVRFYARPPLPGSHVAALEVSQLQLQALTAYVQASFARNSGGHLLPLPQPGYTASDFFLRANGSYHAFRTCNDWTNQALKQAGVRALWKAPFAGPLMHSVKQA